MTFSHFKSDLEMQLKFSGLILQLIEDRGGMGYSLCRKTNPVVEEP